MKRTICCVMIAGLVCQYAMGAQKAGPKPTEPDYTRGETLEGWRRKGQNLDLNHWALGSSGAIANE